MRAITGVHTEKSSTEGFISIGKNTGKPSRIDAFSVKPWRRREIFCMCVNSVQGKAKSKF